MIKDIIETSFNDEKDVYRKMCVTVLSIPNEIMLFADLDGYDTDTDGWTGVDLLFRLSGLESHIQKMFGISYDILYVRFTGNYYKYYKDSDPERNLNHFTPDATGFKYEYDRFLRN